MIRLLVFILFFMLFGITIYMFIMWIGSKNNKYNHTDDCHLIQSEGVLKVEKKNSEDWWYSTPHYYVMSNGERFNIAEYITWDVWKNLDKSSRAAYCIQIENRLLNPSRPTENKAGKVLID